METRKNTLRLAFASPAKVPAHLDVLKFMMKVLKVPATDVHSVYKDENDQKFYVKFIDDTSFNRFTGSMDEQYVFHYGDDEKAHVKLEMASRQFKYIRIFNVPPETDDKDIAAVLGQFGRIRQHVRERYPAEYGYQVFSGIRGVHMEIEREIPANLYIKHFRARLYYDGLKNRCFFCKAEGHIKAECPKLAGLRENPTDSHLYSRVAANLNVATRKEIFTDAPSTSMTVLQIPKKTGENVAMDSNDMPNRKLNVNNTKGSNAQEVVEKHATASPTTTSEAQHNITTPTIATEEQCGSTPMPISSEVTDDAQQMSKATDENEDTRQEGKQQLKRPPGTISETESSDIESGKGRGRKKKAYAELASSVHKKSGTRSRSNK